ncbi:MAG: HAD-IC family P-type ATPase [bacterium]|nr:HAD-IC family P-type ATPase [bacterium]
MIEQNLSAQNHIQKDGHINWHSLYLEEVYEILRTKPGGLSQEDGSGRLFKYGPNEFEEFKRRGLFSIFFDQLKGIFIVILIIAAVISFFLGDTPDAVIILAIVLLNSTVGFVQEYKADKTFRLLQESLEKKAVVIRNGEEMEILRRLVVPGDIAVIERGRVVPADCRIIESKNLLVNESVLTGEWMAVKKTADVFAEEMALADRTNMLFMGTVVEDGLARAVVVSTGRDTEFGKIGEKAQAAYDTNTPLEKALQKFSLFLGLFISAVVALLFVLGLIKNVPPLQMFLSSVALAVAAVPEGLAVALTIILAIGMKRILQHRGLVRKLLAAETLGSVSLIATDKTGTITEARMQVSHVITGTKELFRDGDGRMPALGSASSDESHMLALKFVAITSEAVIENPEAELEEYRIRGRPTDRALTEAALEAGLRKDDFAAKGGILDTLSFDETRKFSAAIIRGEKENTLAVVGAPEKILENSRELHVDGHTASLKSEYFQKISERYAYLVRSGLRVVAVAHKDTNEIKINLKSETLISGLSFVGFIAMRDPVRKEVAEAIVASREAGIKTVIITGDHASTARAVAAEVGLKISEKETMEGSELETLSQEALRERAGSIILFARVSPEHKVRIVEAFQKNGESVAMVGDGINDAPALKQAEIGVVLESGTDVAKSSADLLLLNNSFATIIAAIREGRTIVENLRKTLVFLLSDGFTEVVIVALSILFHFPLPLLPAQILWINLIEDSLPSLALAFEKGSPELMRMGPEKKLKLLDGKLSMLIVFFGVIVSVSAFGLFWWLYKTGGSIEYARTMVLALVGVNSLFYVFSVKNLRGTIFSGRLFDNLFLIASLFVGFLLMATAVYAPVLQKLLETVPLHALDWAVIVVFGVFNIVLIEILKFVFLRFAPRNGFFKI